MYRIKKALSELSKSFSPSEASNPPKTEPATVKVSDTAPQMFFSPPTVGTYLLRDPANCKSYNTFSIKQQIPQEQETILHEGQKYNLIN